MPLSDKALVLLVEDDPQLRKLLARSLEAPDRRVESADSGRAALAALAQEEPALLLLDLGLPDMPGLAVLKQALAAKPDRVVVILTSQADEQNVVEAMRLGAHDFLSKDMALDAVGKKVAEALAEAVRRRSSPDALPPARPGVGGNLIGRSPAMLEVLKQIGVLAGSDVPVLILGESGTGKERVARALHAHGPDAAGPFVAVDCASLPLTLLESELFGYEKGAFTGAAGSKKGRLEEADGGTLFLDEVGNLSLDAAGKLLRVLQERTVQRLGSNLSLPWKARVVAASNVDLWAKARRGEYREDLIFRLAGAEIKLPPLRERSGDLEILARHFLAQAGQAGDGISADAMALLRGYPWPGNVRELEHALRRGLAGARGRQIQPAHLPEAIRGSSVLARAGISPAASPADIATMEDIKRQYAAYALELCGGNRADAARKLDIDRRTLNALVGEGDGATNPS